MMMCDSITKKDSISIIPSILTCEREHLEPLSTVNEVSKYLVDRSSRKDSSELSIIEFGLRLSDLVPVVFKTIPQRELAEREVSMFGMTGYHPNILQIEEALVDDQGRAVLVMPLLKKIEMLNKDLSGIAVMIRDLMKALAHIHSKGIAHLDINPNNIMCDNNDHLVLIDFGLSRKCCDEPIAPCGTPGYIAPEMYTGNAHGTYVDIYSAGIILGSLLEPYVPDCYLNYLGCRCEMGTQSLCTLIDALDSFSQERCYNIRPSIVYDAVNLLQNMLNPNPNQRITAAEALNHPFLTASHTEFDGTDINSYTSTLQIIRYHRSVSASPVSSYEYDYY